MGLSLKKLLLCRIKLSTWLRKSESKYMRRLKIKKDGPVRRAFCKAKSLLGVMICFCMLVFCVNILSACGFEPVYGFSKQRDDAAEDLLAQVRISLINDRVGQELRNELLDRMNPKGRPSQPQYDLVVSVVESVADLGIQRDDTATFAKQVVTANFALIDIRTKKEVLSAVSRSNNSYNILRSSPYATQSAEDDARRRAALQIADDITGRVALFLKTYKAQQKEQSLHQPNENFLFQY